MRILVLALVAIVVWLALEGLWKEIRQKLADSRRPQRSSAQPESLVACARCGVYVPLSRAQRMEPDQAICQGCLKASQGQEEQKRSRAG